MTPTLRVTAQHTQTLAQGGKGVENSECTFVSVIGQAVRFVLIGAPGPVREGGGGQAGGILSPFAWVGSSSSQGGEEEMKPLSYVACLSIKDGGGIKVGSESERKTPANAGACAGVGGVGGARGRVKRDIVFPASS